MVEGAGLFESIRAFGRNHTCHEKSGLENWATNRPQHTSRFPPVRLAIGGHERLTLRSESIVELCVPECVVEDGQEEPRRQHLQS